jgi:hypothetical protein
MRALSLTHLQSLLLYAVVVSIAFALISRSTARRRIRYAVLAFFAFFSIAVAIGWLMYFFPR